LWKEGAPNKNAFPMQRTLLKPRNTHLCVLGLQGAYARKDSSPQEIDNRRDRGCNENPEKLKPVKERYMKELRLPKVIEWRIHQSNKWDNQQEEKPGTLLSQSSGNHIAPPLVHSVQEQPRGKAIRYALVLDDKADRLLLNNQHLDRSTLSTS
jgi:hypothetical protein